MASKTTQGVDEVTSKLSQLSVNQGATQSTVTDPSKKTKVELQTWWDKNSPTLVGERKENSIKSFSHCTSSENKQQIDKDHKLKGCKPDFGPLAGRDIKGVYFTASLFHGGLPDKSPYGPERVLIPISSIVTDMSEWSMYFELAYKMSTGRKNEFVRFVLVKNTNIGAKTFCDNHLVKVNMKTNPLLHWKEVESQPISSSPMAQPGNQVPNPDPAGKVTGHQIYKQGLGPGLFTIVFVVRDVSTEPEWDTITHNNADGGKPKMEGFDKYTFLW